MESATRQTTAIMALREDLSGYERQFAALLPSHVTTRKFFRIALNAVQHNPKLLECDQLSFRMALMECTSMGLCQIVFGSLPILYHSTARSK